MSEQNTKNRIKNWLGFIFAVVLPPTILLLGGLLFAQNSIEDQKMQTFERQSARLLAKVAEASHTEANLCNGLNLIFDTENNPGQIASETEHFLQSLELNYQILVWNSRGEIAFSSFDHSKLEGDLNRAYFDLLDFYNGKYRSEAKIPQNVYVNLRSLFGPHFFPRYVKFCYKGRDKILLNNDSSGKRPLLWLKVTEKAGMAIFFDHSVIESYAMVKNLIKQQQSQNIELAIELNGRIMANPAVAGPVSQAFKHFATGRTGSMIIEDKVIVPAFIDDNLKCCAVTRLNRIRSYRLPKWLLVVLAGTLMILALIAYIGYQTMVNRRFFFLSLRYQLILLFLFANLVTGSSILFIAKDYLEQYRQSLVSSAYNQSQSFLHAIDKLLLQEYTWQKKRIHQSTKTLLNQLKDGKMTPERITGFFLKQQPEPYRFYLVASSTGYVAGDEAIMKGNRIAYVLDDKFNRGPHKEQQLRALGKMGRFFLAMLNHTKISAKEGTEVEMLTEAYYLKKPLDVLQDFISKNDSFFEWGIGANDKPAYIRLIQLFNKNSFDYLMLMFHNSDSLQRNYIERALKNFSRNSLGLDIIAFNDKHDWSSNAGLEKHTRLNAFAHQLQNETSKEPEFCIWKQKPHLISGMKCNQTYHFRLIGLLPLDRIEQRVIRRQNLLLKLAALNLLITVSLGLLLANAFLDPLKKIERGITALKEGNYKFRLPDLGYDELGQTARLFNSTLSDLEEMQAAGRVRDRLTTQPLKPVTKGQFKIIAEKISSIEMGGDFFDYNDLHESGARLFIGDTAGTGVTATIFQALAASALIQYRDSDPATLIARLNQLLIRCENNFLKRHIACTCVYLSAAENKLLLANAGLCAIAVCNRAMGKTTFLQIPGAPVGVKSGHSSQFIELKHNEALILFTNKILQNQKVSFDQLAKTLAAACSFSDSLEDFNNEFKKLYLSQFPCDNADITMISIENTYM